jgi:pre-mRNA-splicing factor CDC5/CEF1
MRIQIKGGVWKNTEDEILKAAVMKYGKNQWPRISSLLNRKSAKQCKARWYEWLDPSIKKTEWTREEDEKLLHLAKLMPTQWRTIAPVVGRTPSQCLERYEKLLDAACARDDDYDAADDPRRLRPGEIDPNPETKPAKPDAVDMDEDEKEMLAEARARLANTKGKKAKRKAREKQLEEARRLAELQKKRELKAAGIAHVRRAKRVRGVDYNAEIAFERKPDAVMYDTMEEDEAFAKAAAQKVFKPVSIAELEGKQSAKQIDEESKKREAARQKMHERRDMPGAVEQALKVNDASFMRRSKLMLPTPQVSDRELEDIAKIGKAGVGLLDDGSATPASALLGSYEQTPVTSSGLAARTPMRTPQVEGDAILREAQQQAARRNQQSTLLGGAAEAAAHMPTDFAGATPSRANVAATPSRSDVSSQMGATPALRGSVGQTPLRDGLNINDQYAAHFSDLSERERRAQSATTTASLKSAFMSLPKPQNEYQIDIPDAPVEDEVMEDVVVEDEADVRAREAAALAEYQAMQLRKRSQAVQRGLPLPDKAAGNLSPLADDDISKIVNDEAQALLEHDIAKYGKKPTACAPLEDFDESAVIAARNLITTEADAMLQELNLTREDFATVFSEALAKEHKNRIFVPSANAQISVDEATKEQQLEAAKATFERVRAEMEKDAKRAAKLEQKCSLLTTGLQKRNKELCKGLRKTIDEIKSLATEAQSYAMLHVQEERSAPSRIEYWLELVEAARAREKVLQSKYETLTRQLSAS